MKDFNCGTKVSLEQFLCKANNKLNMIFSEDDLHNVINNSIKYFDGKKILMIANNELKDINCQCVLFTALDTVNLEDYDIILSNITHDYLIVYKDFYTIENIFKLFNKTMVYFEHLETTTKMGSTIPSLRDPGIIFKADRACKFKDNTFTVIHSPQSVEADYEQILKLISLPNISDHIKATVIKQIDELGENIITYIYDKCEEPVEVLYIIFAGTVVGEKFTLEELKLFEDDDIYRVNTLIKLSSMLNLKYFAFNDYSDKYKIQHYIMQLNKYTKILKILYCL